MALKEGKCPNCGSLLQLDEKNDQGHCLFCDAVFSSSEAYAIAANPDGVTFPNAPQPKYSGPNLNPLLSPAQANVRSTQIEQTRKKEAKVAEKAAQPTYVLRSDIKIPDLKLSNRTRFQLILGAVVILAIVVGLSMPMILARNTDRAALIAAIGDYIPVPVDVEQEVVIHGLSNQSLSVALPTAITAEDAKAIFLAYGVSRAAVQSKTTDNFEAAYSDITVKIISPAGGFLINRPASQAALDDGTAIQTLS